MNVELITIGSEILDGRITDTNKQYIGQELQKAGLNLNHVQTVADRESDIVNAFQLAQKRSQLVLVSGGLGPTTDDMTALCFAKFAQVEFKENQQARQEIEVIFKKINKEINSAQLKQALLPVGAEVLSNPHGTAPGFHFKKENTQWYFFPGVPGEMKPMFQNNIINKFQKENSIRSFTWSTIFSSEGDLQESLKALESRLDSRYYISFHTHFPFNYVALHEKLNEESSNEEWVKIQEEISLTVRDYCFEESEHEADFLKLFFQKIKKENLKLGTVESCTGGLIANLITNLPGSSSQFISSWITYANEAKINLGVPQEILEKHGAVSEECAEAMLEAGLENMNKLFPNDDLVCLATTGIAGPDGGSDSKPVGTCYLGYALYCKESNEIIMSVGQAPLKKNFSRQKYKELFAYSALYKLFKALA